MITKFKIFENNSIKAIDKKIIEIIDDVINTIYSDDIDESVFIIQNLINQDDGGQASIFFSDDDYEFKWPTLSFKFKIGKLDGYVSDEINDHWIDFFDTNNIDDLPLNSKGELLNFNNALIVKNIFHILYQHTLSYEEFEITEKQKQDLIQEYINFEKKFKSVYDLFMKKMHIKKFNI